MIRPPLEVADLVRAAGTAFIERNRQWIGWPQSKCCWPLPVAVPPHSAVISPPDLTAHMPSHCWAHPIQH